MGYIYKITNKLNSKIYIGQTAIDLKQRWRDHCRVSFNSNNRDYSFPIHAAIRKYGKENFSIELIEEIPNNLLDEREIFWINYFNSYIKGYNATTGGLGHQKYNYDEIVNYYLQNGFSISQTCEHFKIYDQVVYSALKSKNINYKELSKKSLGTKPIKKPILLVEKNIVFKSMADIDRYFQKTAHPNIRRCLKGITQKAYGYHWKELSSLNDAPEEAIIYE